jgi:hypothetical protein
MNICIEKEPDLIEVDKDHFVRCWLYQDADGHHAPLKA